MRCGSTRFVQVKQGLDGSWSRQLWVSESQTHLWPIQRDDRVVGEAATLAEAQIGRSHRYGLSRSVAAAIVPDRQLDASQRPPGPPEPETTTSAGASRVRKRSQPQRSRPRCPRRRHRAHDASTSSRGTGERARADQLAPLSVVTRPGCLLSCSPVSRLMRRIARPRHALVRSRVDLAR